MSYFDDMEDRKSFTINRNWKAPKVHLTNESFRHDVEDTRFVNLRTVCGLDFPQTSGRIVKRKSKVTCKECLKYEI
jgi:hypothetical protein